MSERPGKRDLHGTPDGAQAYYGLTQATDGNAMLRVQKKLYLRHSVSPITIATTYALVGNKAETLRCLQSAYELRDGSLLFVETYPEFDSLRDEPAYRDLLARMNLPLQDTK